MWGNFGILESYVGERVNKIRFVRSINRKIRFRSASTYVSEEKRKKAREERRDQESCNFCIIKVRVSLAIQLY